MQNALSNHLDGKGKAWLTPIPKTGRLTLKTQSGGLNEVSLLSLTSLSCRRPASTGLFQHNILKLPFQQVNGHDQHRIPGFNFVVKTGVTAAMVLLAQVYSPAYAQSYSKTAFYQNPDTLRPGVTRESWALQPCRDPWINIAYAWALGIRPSGQGDQGECWTGQYAKGRWRNYNELVHAVASYKQCMKRNQAAYGYNGNRWVVVDNRNGRIVGNNSASINQLVSQGGGNIVSQGGGNFTLQSATPVSCAN